MTLLCPFWTQFWSHFGSQVPNYTPLWGARLRFLRFFLCVFKADFSMIFGSIRGGDPHHRIEWERVPVPVFFNLSG